MFERLQSAENRYDELNLLLSDPSVLADQNNYRKLMKEHSDLSEVIGKYQEYKRLEIELNQTKDMLAEQTDQDKDLTEMTKEEQKSLEERLEALLLELKAYLMPSDPHDDRSVIMEIRAGAGGEEAALFASSLFRMYSMYAEKKRWKTEVIDSSPTEIGGFREIVFAIEAKGAYSRLKFESGVHRVQRIPDTEANGRIHTSTVTVAVMPEMDEVEVDINPADLQIDTYRAGGAGGQHINKTESAIRITHLPTGLVVTCQDQRSQHKNRESAMKVLASRLYDQALQRQESEVTKTRRSQVGTGDRSERIRTYNFPQCRVTDHRIGFSIYRINDVMEGDLDELIDVLATSEKSEAPPEDENDD